MDKILQSTGRGREVTVTNDGATILKSLHIDNPAAKVLVVQDDEVGDGTTSIVVLAGGLLREAEKLVAAKIRPMTIISGGSWIDGCWETACASVHGANRLGANSLLDIIVFDGARANRVPEIRRPGEKQKPLEKDAGQRTIAWLDNAAVFRTQETLQEGVQLIDKTWESFHDVKVKDCSLI